VRSTDCQRPPQPPTTHAQRSTDLPLQRSGNTRVHAAQRDAHTHEQSTAERNPRSASPSRTSHSETRCSNAHATTHIRNRDTAVQHPTHCARDSAGYARPTRAFCIAPMTQPRFFTYSQAQRAPRAHADQRRAPRYHHTTHTRAQTRTTRQAPPTTTPRQRHGACHPKQRTPTSHAPHIAHSHTAHKHTSPAHTPARRPAQPRPLRTAQTSLHAHRRTHAPHTARHTAPRSPHTAHTAHRKSHPVTHAASAPHSLQSSQVAQCRRDAAGELVAVQVQRPAGHTNSHRITPWQPTPRPTPASRPLSASQCIA
jgi:hypothetical protein